MTQPVPNTSTPGSALPGAADVEVTDWFAAQLRAALSNPLLYIPKTFETWMTDRNAVAGLDIPIGQIVGFTQYTAQSSTVAADESTTSDIAVDLTTVGPTISGLPNGSYLVLFGAEMRNSSALATMLVEANETSVGKAARAGGSSELISASTVAPVTLDGGSSNELVAKYKRDGSAGTAEFQNRWVIALRTANA